MTAATSIADQGERADVLQGRRAARTPVGLVEPSRTWCADPFVAESDVDARPNGGTTGRGPAGPTVGPTSAELPGCIRIESSTCRSRSGSYCGVRIDTATDCG